MEIITNINYDDSRHTIVEFLKARFKPFIIHLMDPRIVAKALDGKTIYQAIETIVNHNWTIMKVKKGVIVGQMVKISLADNAWVHVYLLTQGYGDRAVMLLSGQHKKLNYLDIGYVGDEHVFEDYVEKMNLDRFEVIGNAYHYVGEEDDIDV